MASITDILMAQGRLEAQNRLRRGQLVGDLVGAVGEMPGQFLQQRAAEQLRQAQQRRAEQELAIKQDKERREEDRAVAMTGIAINKETREQDEAERKAMTEDATRLLASGRGDTTNTLRYLERYQHRLDPSLLEELKQGAYTAPDAVLSQFGTPPKAPERPNPVGAMMQFTVPNTPEPVPVQRMSDGTMVDVRTGQPVQLPTTARVYEKPAAEAGEYITIRGAGGKPQRVWRSREQLTQGVEIYDKPDQPLAPVVVQGATGPLLLDRGSNVARPVMGPDNKPVGPPPTAQSRNLQESVGRVRPILDSVKELSERINTQQGVIAKIAGEAERAKAKINLDDDVAEYEAMVSAFTPLWARALGHVGVLTEQDVQSAREALPKPSDSKSLRDRKLARIEKIMGGGATPSPSSDGGLSYEDYLKSRPK